jgi:hypothetical protein
MKNLKNKAYRAWCKDTFPEYHVRDFPYRGRMYEVWSAAWQQKEKEMDSRLLAVRCALADLCGAYQAMQQGDMHAHFWAAHHRSINELAEAFGLEAEVPEDCK